MRRFKTFLRERGFDVTDFPGADRPLGNLGVEEDGDSLLKVLKLAVEENYPDVEDFLHNLGRKNPHVRDALDDLNRHSLNRGLKGKQGSGMPGDVDDQDVVVPHGPDKGGQDDGLGVS
jgi:hypothetical protein